MDARCQNSHLKNTGAHRQEREDKELREQLTKSDVKKIEQEIEYRKLVVRKEAIEAVKEARAHGDLSENFEYHAAKKDFHWDPFPCLAA